MPSVVDLKKELTDKLAEFDRRAKELAAQRDSKDRAKDYNAWLADRAKEVKEINDNAARRIKELGAEYTQRFKGFDTDTNNEKLARQKDINNEKDSAAKRRMQDELTAWLKSRTDERARIVAEQQNALKDVNTSKTNDITAKTNEINKYKADFTAETNNYNKQINDIVAKNGAKNQFAAQQTQAIQQRGVAEAQSKLLGIDADEYEQFLAKKDDYKQLKQEYQPYLGQLTENKTRDAAIAQIAAAQKIDPSVLKNYFASKEITPLYEEATKAQTAAAAKAEADSKAAQQAQAAKAAQMQEYANQMAAKMEARKAQNYAQMYNVLSQNMPVPVGYAQPATSRQAQTTMLDAGGGGYGIMSPQQMSPAQIAQMSGIMPQGTPLPPELMQQLAQQQASRQAAQQQVAQESPQGVQPAKRGGIMRGM